MVILKVAVKTPVYGIYQNEWCASLEILSASPFQS